MSSPINAFGGVLGTVAGFVVLSQGVKLIRDSEKEYYKSKGHKIHPLKKLPGHYKKTGKIKSNNVMDNIRIPRYF